MFYNSSHNYWLTSTMYFYNDCNHVMARPHKVLDKSIWLLWPFLYRKVYKKSGKSEKKDNEPTVVKKNLWEISFSFHRKFHIFSHDLLITTDYGRPEREKPSPHGRKFNPNPKFLGTAEAYFVCHIGSIFQISLIYAFIGCP